MISFLHRNLPGLQNFKGKQKKQLQKPVQETCIFYFYVNRYMYSIIEFDTTCDDVTKYLHIDYGDIF